MLRLWGGHETRGQRKARLENEAWQAQQLETLRHYDPSDRRGPRQVHEDENANQQRDR